MQITQKDEIISAVKAYMAEKGMTAADINKLTGVSQSYLSQMLNGKYVALANGKEVEISDKHFVVLAETVGMSVDKVYWKTVITRQMRQIITSMTTAKQNGGMATIICNTGMGKTFCVEKFVRENPKHTYVVTISSLVRLHDVINMLLEAMGLPVKGSKALRMINIIMKLREIKRMGGRPVIVIEEAENMEHSLIKMIKGLFDGIAGYASIVQIGTDQLLTKMLKAKNQNMDGGPQYYRRFKASIINISTVVDFEPFFNEFVADKKLQKLLTQLCDNYGELNAYLEPALREADVRGVPLTEEIFRQMYNMAA